MIEESKSLVSLEDNDNEKDLIKLRILLGLKEKNYQIFILPYLIMISLKIFCQNLMINSKKFIFI